jgi:hypothetical protein
MQGRRDSKADTTNVIGVESLRALYLAERQRRQHVRSQLAIPVSIISFSIFGYVSFAQYFDALQADPVTIVIDVLMLLSLASLLVAAIFLARTELTFMRVEMGDLEDLTDVGNECEYFRRAYLNSRRENALAARHRARSFLILLLALAFFVAAVALVPFHLRDNETPGRTAGSAPQELALKV